MKFSYATMSAQGASTGTLILKILGLYFLAPACVSLCIHHLMVRMGLVKPGDMKLG